MQGGVAAEAGIRNLGLRTGQEKKVIYIIYLGIAQKQQNLCYKCYNCYNATVEVTML